MCLNEKRACLVSEQNCVPGYQLDRVSRRISLVMSSKICHLLPCDHETLKTGPPARSILFEQRTVGLVVSEV
jgi:hypothetical protein